MLFERLGLKPQTIGFHYPDRSNIFIRLEGIGWEKVESTSYRWNGRDRDQKSTAIFQFTLSGRGEIRVGSTIHSLPKNYGFLCTVPGDHEYYLPEGEEHWEIFFINVHGEDALRNWAALEQKLGTVFKLSPKAPPIEILFRLYSEIVQAPLTDKYDISAALYRFVLQMNRHADVSGSTQHETISEPIMQAVSLIKERYREDLSLDILAEAADLTKYHFCRLFQRKIGIKPMHYIRKVRIERAVWLLGHTEMKIAQIGEECGFSHTNYFIKTFRGMIGSTPGEYRLLPKHSDFDHLKVEI